MSKPAQDPRQAFDCRATAALLRALGPLIWASQAAAIIAAGFRYGWVSLACWMLVLYFAVRVQLDAGLFELMAEDAAPVDDWLVRAGLRSPSPGRTLEDRCRGARRLARRFVLAWIAQMAALAAVVLRGNA